MPKAILFAMFLLALFGGMQPAQAADPGEVVTGIYAQYPWTDLPPGGHGAWYPDTAVAWAEGAADAGKAFLVGPAGRFTKVDTEIVASGGDEVRIRATLFRDDGTVHVLNFGMIGDDDEDDRWRVIEVFTDDGRYLSDVLAHR